MIKNNLLGLVLIVLLVLFLLIGSIQLFGIGQGIDDVEIDPENQVVLPTVPRVDKAQEVISLDNAKQLIGKITERPMFSLDRTPYVAPEVNPEESSEGKDKVVIVEIKAKLTGVVITPDQSYAMILDNITNQRETYKVGMPLEGEQGGWTLTAIQNRKVVFTSDDDKIEELELEVFGGTKVSAKGKNKGKANGNRNGKQLSRTDKKKNADDIRKKIAERRAQMRAEAAKKKK